MVGTRSADRQLGSGGYLDPRPRCRRRGLGDGGCLPRRGCSGADSRDPAHLPPAARILALNSGLGARIRFWGGYWLPSVLGSALGFIRRRKPVAAPAVLGVLLPEHMGDVVMTGPLLRSLRRRYPHARIMVAVPARLVGLLRGCPHVSDVLEWLPGRVAAMDLARRLRLAGCDLVVVPRSDPDRAWAPLVAARCGAPERVTLTAAVTVWARLRRLQGWPFFNVPILPPHGVRHEVMRRLSLSTYWSGDPADSALESWAT